MANVSVNVHTTIGRHVILNTNCCVDHDCVLEDFVHISPHASLAGNVQVGEGTQIGIGASIKQNIRIGKWVMIGAGAVIIRDVPDYSVVVGNPGRIIKTNQS
jgi:acetyltransferase EpsM